MSTHVGPLAQQTCAHTWRQYPLNQSQTWPPCTFTGRARSALLQGCIAHKKTHPRKDRHRSLGMVLL